jgi:hypothetical protein
MLSWTRKTLRFSLVLALSFMLVPTSPNGELGAAEALAKPAAKKKPKKEAAPSPTLTPISSPTPPPTPAAPKAPVATKAARATDAFAGESTQSLLDKARALYAALEYADVIPLAEAVLARTDITIDQRLDAYLLQGSSLAIVGDAIEAEKPFRFLLRGRPDFEMPAETPPKILAVFRKVQVEEKAIVDQMKELARQRAIKEIEVKSDVPTETKGGVPLIFEYKLKDPRGAVAAMDLHYRKGPSDPFSSLALKVDDSGFWKAELPGDWTENDSGFTLQYFLTTKDAEATNLVTMGGPASPLAVQVSAGKVSTGKPFYKSWWFWTVTSAVLVAGGGVVGWVLYDQATSLPQTSGRIDLRE